MLIYENRHFAPTKIQKIYQSFIDETKSELWDSETELIKYFEKDENYQDLLNGSIGGNVIYKHKAMGLADSSNDWCDFLTQICMKLVREHEINEESQKERVKEILQISEFVKKKLSGVLQVNADTSPLRMKSDYDIFGWMKSDIEAPFSDFLQKEPIYYDFTFTTEQLNARKDQFKRYGTDHNALSKIVTRVSNVESLFRNIKQPSDPDLLINQEESDRFVRYTLSN